MGDLGYDDDDEEEKYDDYQARARELLVNNTRENIKTNLQGAGLAMCDRIFIVCTSVIYALVTVKKIKKTTPEIDERPLFDSILEAVHARRYGSQPQGPAQDQSN